MKKVLGFIGLTAMAVGLFVTTQNVDKASSTNFADMISINKANAECVYNTNFPHLNYGTCSRTPEYKCFWASAADPGNCDPALSN
ncbi:hypothetical protein EOD41_19550 [Mucilaginibacter limnophilus]|uniref:Uncharacterized protein n=1 Tax=Mucilaginibacter limnophilus TaxID=1932778 RepID=A0A3S2V5U1_9SPHI|nr:hypothetical protein [Mucilaginibacter limnophilus]RVT97203.1 hypothetical protein EOD41_19550 [Mucilaginibacter limnophilus]